MKEPFSEKWKRFKMQLKCAILTGHKNRFNSSAGGYRCRDCGVFKVKNII